MQTDPIGYKDNINMYAYADNDPVNFKDPLGLAKCDSSLSGAACETALDDADGARDNASGLAGILREIAGTKSEDRTDEQNAIVDLVKERFGNRAGSNSGLRRVAGGLDNIAKTIGSRGSGLTLSKGDDRAGRDGRVPRAYVQQKIVGGRLRIPNRAFLNSSFLNDSRSDARQSTILHEAGHVAFQSGLDLYTRGGSALRGTSLPAVVSGINRGDPYYSGYNLYINADSYACSVPGYQRVC